MKAPVTPRKRAPASTAAGGVVTLEMVARHAGVSPSTVSRILNGTATVSPAKQQAVDDAIRTLGFRPNPVARGLAGGRTLSIGVLTQTISSPFYGEALRMLEEGVADIATIDWAMKTVGGFRMGPFELMDFIGHDVNYVVTESVWTAMYYDPRYRPSLTQKRLLEAHLELGCVAGPPIF